MKAHGWADLLTMGPDRQLHRVVLGYVNQVFQQVSGINLISYYAATIYEQYIGLESTTARLLAAANGTEYFLASWIAVYTIEKFGRRQLMLFGAAGMAGTMALLAGMNYMSSVNIGGSAPSVVSAVMLFVFNTFFAIGWLGMTCDNIPLSMSENQLIKLRALPRRNCTPQDPRAGQRSINISQLG